MRHTNCIFLYCKEISILTNLYFFPRPICNYHRELLKMSPLFNSLFSTLPLLLIEFSFLMSLPFSFSSILIFFFSFPRPLFLSLSFSFSFISFLPLFPFHSHFGISFYPLFCIFIFPYSHSFPVLAYHFSTLLPFFPSIIPSFSFPIFNNIRLKIIIWNKKNMLL